MPRLLRRHPVLIHATVATMLTALLALALVRIPLVAAVPARHGMLAAWIGAANLVAFAHFAFDKHLARRGAFRVPEAALLWTTLLLGDAGALAAILALRHKTRKPRFLAGYVLVLVVHAIGACIALRSG